MRDDPNEERDGWIIRPRESFRFKNAHPLCRIFFFSFSLMIHIFSFFFLQNDRAKIDGDVATVGITDHAQAELGDIVYVELPEVGSAMEATKSFGVVESVKAASDVYSPISGTVIEINEALNDSPGTVNDSPFEGGWLMKVKVSDVPGSLMDAAAYEKSIA
jgi:glycine cleavage system H protein